MGINLNDNLAIHAPKPADARYGPFNSTGAALFYIPSSERYKGLTVGILQVGGEVQDYWFKSGTADIDLVVKDTALSDLANSVIVAGNY